MKSDQILPPQMSSLSGMTRDRRYLLQVSTLVSVQNLFRAPIDALASSRPALIS